MNVTVNCDLSNGFITKRAESLLAITALLAEAVRGFENSLRNIPGHTRVLLLPSYRQSFQINHSSLLLLQAVRVRLLMLSLTQSILRFLALLSDKGIQPQVI